MIPPSTSPSPSLAYSIHELALATSVSRSIIYQEIAAGRLRARKVGRRTAVLTADAVDWLNSRPYAPSRVPR